MFLKTHLLKVKGASFMKTGNGGRKRVEGKVYFPFHLKGWVILGGIFFWGLGGWGELQNNFLLRNSLASPPLPFLPAKPHSDLTRQERIERRKRKKREKWMEVGRRGEKKMLKVVLERRGEREKKKGRKDSHSLALSPSLTGGGGRGRVKNEPPLSSIPSFLLLSLPGWIGRHHSFPYLLWGRGELWRRCRGNNNVAGCA